MGRSLLAALLAALVVAAPASGAPERSTLRAPDAVARSCAADLTPGARGAAVQRWSAPASGLLTIKLDGTRFSDWDLAVFGSTGRRLGSSTSFGAVEHVVTWVQPGESLSIQGCRRLGSDSSVPLSLDLYEASLPSPGPPAQLVEVPISGQSELDRLEATGLDVTHARDAGPDGRAKVVVYSPAERTRLEAAGFEPATVIADMRAFDLAERRKEARASKAAARTPSGRTTYRTPEDYTSEMKALAEGNPSFVRKVTLPLPTLEGRPIEGLEISAGVNRTDDGRPVYVQLGIHHAREWPSGEFPMEFAIDLVNGFKAGDPRIVSLLGKVRTVIIPVVNRDGFAVSRGAGPSPADDDPNATLPLILNDQGAYKRKNCRPFTAASAAIPCAMRAPEGVDLNRNYGAYYGGAGTSTAPNTQNYRGPGPYSEPESEAFHQFSSRRQIVEVISNHTFTDEGVFLRQPGFQADFFPQNADGDSLSPDEAGMKELGDAMGAATGWASRLGHTLGNITGATEDWNYFAQGGFGYTPEGRGPNFHANYATWVAEEYDGKGPLAGEGVREAFLLAGEQSANERDHSVIEGSAGAGRVLRLKKTFETATSLDGVVVSDTLDTTLTVPSDGSYEWHVNPSTRPLFPARSEAWTMTCESASGQVLATAQVTVARGERITQDLACSAAPATGTPSGAAPGASAPAKAACNVPSGRTSAKGLDRARLGRKRATNRSRFLKGGRKRASVDTFCFTDNRNVRIGYPSARLLRKLSAPNRRRTRGRAVLLLTSSSRFSLRGVSPGDALPLPRTLLPSLSRHRVGANTWYLATGGAGRLVFKVRGGKVREVGLADLRLTRGRSAARRFLNSFR